MVDWIYGSEGNATLIFDHDCIRNNHGQVVAWIKNIHVYNLNGHHVGWFEKGVLYDSNNDVLGFTRNRTGHLPSIPGISGIPGTPGFAGKPGRPGFSGIPGRPGFSGWSNKDLSTYF
jgi:hypothetical protein